MNPLRSPEGEGAGAGGTATPPAQPAASANQAPPPTTTGQQIILPPGATGGTPPPAASTPPTDTVPLSEHEALKRQVADLEREKTEREEKEQTEKGQWKDLADRYKGERDQERGKVQTVARRAAYVSAVGGMLGQGVEPMAAYNLAIADGLLNDIAVDADGTADAARTKAAAEETVKRYPFLKGQPSFGQGNRDRQAGQQQPGGQNLSTREKYKVGFQDPAWGVDQPTRRQMGG